MSKSLAYYDHKNNNIKIYDTFSVTRKAVEASYNFIL